MRARRAAHARGTQGASRYDRGVMRTRERIDGAGLAARIAAAAMVSRRSRDDPPLVEQIEEVIVPWPRRRVERRRARRRRLRRRRSRKTIWTWHVLWGLVGCTRRPIPDC